MFINKMIKEFNFNKLCKPSQLYFFMSMASIIFIVIQNLFTSNHSFCMGIHGCNLGFSKWLIFIPQLIYIFVWTVILNSLCKTGYEDFSWFLVLFPFVLFFILMGLFILRGL